MQTDIIEAKMQSRGVKPTAMRLLVYRQLAHSHHPLSLKQLEEQMLTADRSTIFRTLTLLVRHHLVHAIEDGSGAMKYEVCHGHEQCSIDDQHPHFYCEQCGRIYCLHDQSIPELTLPEGFHMRAINYMIKGLCPDCSR